MKTLAKISLVILSLALICVKDKDEFSLTTKFIEESIVKMNDNLYVGKYEVTNQLYRQFVDDLKMKGKTDDLKIANVDSLNWRSETSYNEPYVQYYFRHESYNNYPVVNISYEGAVLFCKWLTEKYNTMPSKAYKKVLFRLADTTEWETAARSGLKDQPGNLFPIDYPWDSKYLKDGKGNYYCNYYKIGDEGISYDATSGKFIIHDTRDYMGVATKTAEYDVTAPVNSFKPNSIGIYNMAGNVAEMVKEKGICKGGSYLSFGYDVRIDAVGKYTKSRNDLGFRYFMEIIEK